MLVVHKFWRFQNIAQDKISSYTVHQNKSPTVRLTKEGQLD